MSQEHHVAVVSFMPVVYSAKSGEDLVRSFDRARKKRNELVYNEAGSISETQARNLVAKAEKFVSTASEILKV